MFKDWNVIYCSKPKYVEQQSISTRPVLVTAEVFNRGRYGTSDSIQDDYLDMEDPPNFDDFMYLRYLKIRNLHNSS